MKKEAGIKQLLNRFTVLLAMIYKKIPDIPSLPKVFPITGEVTVKKTEISNLSELTTYLDRLSSEIKQLTVTLPKTYQIEGNVNVAKIPPVKVTNFPTIKFDKPDNKELIKELQIISKLLEKQKMPEITIPQSEKIDISPLLDAIKHMPTPDFPTEDISEGLARIEQGIAQLYNKPQMTPQPATNMNINALQGSFLATQVTINGVPTLLPPTNLAHRRSMIVYNGSANTIYLGGSTVALAGTGQGLPIPTQSLSPSFDAGDQMALYGISSPNSVVNVFELSNFNTGY